jgi:hypothetical protein
VKLFHYDKKQFLGKFQQEYLNIMLTLLLYPGHARHKVREAI